MFNIGEEIVGAYLEYIKGCEFIQKNLYTRHIQGEIDVVGINLEKRELYVCEVAIHLVTGLQYTKDNQPNNVNKLIDKFSKDIRYAEDHFPDFTKYYMLWSPIVKNQKNNNVHNQLNDVNEVKNELRKQFGVELDLIINERFLECLNELRAFASDESKDIKSPVIRYLQVEEYLKRHVTKVYL